MSNIDHALIETTLQGYVFPTEFSDDFTVDVGLITSDERIIEVLDTLEGRYLSTFEGHMVEVIGYLEDRDDGCPRMIVTDITDLGPAESENEKEQVWDTVLAQRL